MAIEGDLRDMSLPSIVQIICLEQRKVGLILKRQHEEGVIYFDKGEIVHATLGNLEGQEAVYRLLTWPNGAFRTSSIVSTPRRTVVMPWNQLLMQGMQRLDERGAGEAPTPARDVALAARESESDSATENEVILLLSTLEHSASRLADKQIQKRPATALQILTETANQMIEFTEGLLGEDKSTGVMEKTLVQVRAQYSSMQSLQSQDNRLPAQTLVSLYDNASRGARQQVFNDIGRSIMSIMDAFFGLMTSCLQSPLVVGRLEEVYGQFIFDLKRMIDGVRA